jgi:hypothetical protein
MAIRAPRADDGSEPTSEYFNGPSLSVSGETLTIEELLTLRARMENAGDGGEHEWSAVGC